MNTLYPSLFYTLYPSLFCLPDSLLAARKWLAVDFQWPHTGR